MKCEKVQKIVIHLISEYSGQTVKFAARAAMRQFPECKKKEYIWPLIRNSELMLEVLNKVQAKPGIVLYTISDKDLRNMLKKFCRENKIPCISVIGKIVKEISAYLGVGADNLLSYDYHHEENYYDKVDAIEFAFKHDDGQIIKDLDEADFILIGPSRTSKTPTSIYLAFNGFKTANIPYVNDMTNLEYLSELSHPLIVGLIINPSRLVEIREARLNLMQIKNQTNYTDLDLVHQECLKVKRICFENGWPVIDVSRKSIEETAAAVMKIYYDKKKLR